MEKNKVMMIAIIALLVILLITISVGMFFMFKNLGKATNANPEEQTTVVPAVKQEDIKLVTLSDPIYTNLLNGPDEKEHVIRLSLSLGVDCTKEKEGDAFIEMVTAKDVIVKDVIIGVLRNKTFDELKKTDAQEILRDEILTNLQKEFDSNLIVTVYISDLFLQ